MVGLEGCARLSAMSQTRPEQDQQPVDLATDLLQTMDQVTQDALNFGYRIEQGFTFELNLAGVADEHRDEFVATGKPKSNTTKGESN